MRALIIIRDALRKFYSDYDFIIRPVGKFLLAFLMLTILQNRLGYMEYLSKARIIAVCSLLCMFMPAGFISFICCIFLLGDMFEVSYAMAGFSAVLLMIIFVLYFGFRPGTGILMALVPLAYYFRIPFVIPLVLGMAMDIFSAVPTALGVVIYYMGSYFGYNASRLAEAAGTEIIDSFIIIAQGILLNQYMYASMLAFALCIAVVHVISHSSIDHAWTISLVAGSIVLAVFFVAVDMKYGGSLALDLAGIALSFMLALFYELVFYSLDYARTEKLKFEDDDYYYFVKAVPKVKPSDELERRE